MVTFSTSQLMPKNRGPLAKFHSEPIVSFYSLNFIGNTFIDQQPQPFGCCVLMFKIHCKGANPLEGKSVWDDC